MTPAITSILNFVGHLSTGAAAGNLSAAVKDGAAKWKSALSNADTAASLKTIKTAAKSAATPATTVSKTVLTPTRSPSQTSTVALSGGSTVSAGTASSAGTNTATSSTTSQTKPQATTSSTKSASERQQEYLANVRQLLAVHGAGSYVTGASTMDNGADGAAYLPSFMLSAGITPSQAVLDDYSRATGLDPKTASKYAPNFDSATGKYSVSA